MSSATRSIQIEASAEQVFAVLRDYARYPEFLPEVKAVRIGARDEGTVEVTYRVDAKIKPFEFTLKHTELPPDRIRWELVRGELMKENRGHWQVEPGEGGRTKVTYSIELSLGSLTTPALVRALTEQGLPRMLRNFKARVEGLARPSQP